jgi:hypothetical protein
MSSSSHEKSTRPATWPIGDEGGFVMVMVVLLLFAVAVAGATGYQIVQAEAELSAGTEEAQEALAAARAGLDRYVGEHIGVPGDTTTYPIGNADVYVIPRRVVGYGSPATPDLYVIESIAEVADPRYPNSPARRTVRQYAKLHKNPVVVKGALMSVATTVKIEPLRGLIYGGDAAGPPGPTKTGTTLNLETAQCEGNGAGATIYGVYALTDGGTGAAQSGGRRDTGTLTAQQLLDTASVAWAALESTNFPLIYQSTTPPPFSTYPDSFFVWRYPGDLTATSAHSGRGVLIVSGTLNVISGAGSSFSWDGIVLAGAVGVPVAGTYTLAPGLGGSPAIRGALVTGLDLPGQTSIGIGSNIGSGTMTITYQSCNVARANRVLAYFELVDNSRWEF